MMSHFNQDDTHRLRRKFAGFAKLILLFLSYFVNSLALTSFESLSREALFPDAFESYQALPDDEAFSASSGLRLGVQEMTRFGIKEEDFEELAEYMAEVILREKDVAQQVSNFRQRFTKMQYCLPEEQARPLVDELIGSLIKW